MADKNVFAKMREWQLNLFVMGMLALFVAICLLPFAFFGHPGLIYGWLAGSGVSLLAYLSIVFGAKTLLQPDGAKGVSLLLTVVFASVRFLMFAAVLIAAAYVTFYLKSYDFNFWCVFASYLPMPAVLLTRAALNKREANAKKKKEAEGETKE